MGLFLDYSVPLIYVCVFVPIPCCFYYYTFVVWFEIRECDTSNFVLLSEIALAIEGFLWFYTSFEIICSNSVKNAMGILIRIALNLYITLGNTGILTILILPINEHYVSFNLSVSSSVSFFNFL